MSQLPRNGKSRSTTKHGSRFSFTATGYPNIAFVSPILARLAFAFPERESLACLGGWIPFSSSPLGAFRYPGSIVSNRKLPSGAPMEFVMVGMCLTQVAPRCSVGTWRNFLET